MKELCLSIILQIAAISSYCQNIYKIDNNNNSRFINDYYFHFDSCSLPYYTQKIDLRYDNLVKNYKRIPKDIIIKYISNKRDEIGYDWTATNSDNQKEITGYSEYRYYFLCKFKFKSVFLVIYIKDEVSDSTLIYIASYNEEGKKISKLKLYGFIADNEIIKSVIKKDFNIETCNYEPIDSFKRTKITIYNYRISDEGKFELINIEYRESNNDFLKYINSKKNPDDDPINDLPK